MPGFNVFSSDTTSAPPGVSPAPQAEVSPPANGGVLHEGPGYALFAPENWVDVTDFFLGPEGQRVMEEEFGGDLAAVDVYSLVELVLAGTDAMTPEMTANALVAVLENEPVFIPEPTLAQMETQFEIDYYVWHLNLVPLHVV